MSVLERKARVGKSDAPGHTVIVMYTPVEVVVAALSTESSTMEELECFGTIPVRAFIHCTTRNAFDVCMMGS